MTHSLHSPPIKRPRTRSLIPHLIEKFRQFTRASVAPVVDTLLVHAKPVLERHRCKADVWPRWIVRFVTNVAVVDDAAFKTVSIERAIVWIPATACACHWFRRITAENALVVPAYD